MLTLDARAKNWRKRKFIEHAMRFYVDYNAHFWFKKLVRKEIDAMVINTDNKKNVVEMFFGATELPRWFDLETEFAYVVRIFRQYSQTKYYMDDVSLFVFCFLNLEFK